VKSSHALLLGLIAALVVCSLALITAQQRTRDLFVVLDREQQATQRLEAEGDRLRVELGRVAQSASVESAARALGLQRIDVAHTAFLPAPAGSTLSAAPEVKP
jgi:cell division protein FtsL